MSTAATTGVQLALDCDPAWAEAVPHPRPRRGRSKRITASEQRDLHGQRLTPWQIKRIRTIRL